MSKHVTISPAEAANRLAIRELIEAYAHCADRRDAKGQMFLFTPDTHFVVYMNAKDPKPSQELHSREALAPVFADLNRYAATMYFIGQSTILSLTDDRGTGEAYCLAHHLTVDGDKRQLMIAALRYDDTFVKMDGSWLFAERLLYVDWLESALCRDARRARSSSAPAAPLTGQDAAVFCLGTYTGAVTDPEVRSVSRRTVARARHFAGVVRSQD